MSINGRWPLAAVIGMASKAKDGFMTTLTGLIAGALFTGESRPENRR